MNAKAPSRGAVRQRDEGESIEWTPTIAPEKVCEFLMRMREFQAKEAGDDLESGSNASDDGMRVVLEDEPNDAVQSELVEFIRGLNIDEQIDLVALAWLGRGDGSREDWATLRAEAAREHSERTAASYLIRTPMLPDYLGDALSEFGRTCD
jgi:hypothetical protein